MSQAPVLPATLKPWKRAPQTACQRCEYLADMWVIETGTTEVLTLCHVCAENAGPQGWQGSPIRLPWKGWLVLAAHRKALTRPLARRYMNRLERIP